MYLYNIRGKGCYIYIYAYIYTLLFVDPLLRGSVLATERSLSIKRLPKTELWLENGSSAHPASQCGNFCQCRFWCLQILAISAKLGILGQILATFVHFFSGEARQNSEAYAEKFQTFPRSVAMLNAVYKATGWYGMWVIGWAEHIHPVLPSYEIWFVSAFTQQLLPWRMCSLGFNGYNHV